jgi:ribosomal protein S8
MSTSLIGKALAFDPSEYRFEPCVLKYMHVYSPSYVQNHIHFALAQRNPQSKIVYTRKTIMIVQILAEIGCIHRFIITNNKQLKHSNYTIWLTIFLYNNTPFFKSFRLLSTPSKHYTISYKALRILTSSIGASTIVLSTSTGLITHNDALKKRVGGLLLYILS